jgi:RNA 2',3'-cyclic 3'-phosphodiesterase
MMEGGWRLFVAVPIGEKLRDALAASVETWRDRPDLAGMRWTDPSSWHVTLLFLGATDPASVPDISARLEEIAAAHEPMTLATAGLGGFSSAGRARVAWYGVADPERRLRRLADDVRRALAPGEAPRFRAHLTLGRARGEPADLRPWIGAARPPEAWLAVDEIRLMRSHLGHGPARHETVATARIGTAIHA